MNNDETTDETQVEQQESQEVIEETPSEEQPKLEPKDEVTLSPAEYRHFKKWEKSKNETNEVRISQDLIALTNAKVHEDDVPEVEDYARFKGISVAEALKVGVIKNFLSEKREQRDTAVATNTSPSRRSNTKLTPELMLNNARQGKDIDDVALLAEARFQERRNQSQR